MTYQQVLAFGLVVVTIGCFVWGRFRYDVVALAALMAGVVLGVVPAKKAFDGFSNDVVVIIGSALVVSAGFARSGLIEALLRPIAPRLKSAASQVPVFVGAVTLLSMATKNVGALAIMMPIALQTARRTDTPPSRLLMPMAFGSLLGGLVTLVGTSPNIIVSEVRQNLFGAPFGMFDFAPVGLALAAMGMVFLCFAYRLLPRSRPPGETLEAALEANTYVTEVRAPDDWTGPYRRIGDLHKAGEGDVAVIALLRDGKRRSRPHPNTHLQAGDVLLLEGAQQALDGLISRAKLKLTRSDRPVAMEEPTEEVLLVEGVVAPDSMLGGESAQRLDLHGKHGVNLLAVSRSGYRLNQALNTVRLRPGDIVLLQGGERTMPGALKTLGVLPLVERDVRLGGLRRAFAPLAILTTAMLLVAFHVAPVSIAFFGAAVAMVAFGGLRMRAAYSALDGPVLVLMGALIPVGEAIHATGGAEVAAAFLSQILGPAPPLLGLGLLMLLSMLSAPFMHNAPTVLVFAPIAAGFARHQGLNPDAFLMAVAVGAGCDFLTPIGHQCNTLVMGPGGYRFWDYPRLGAPLSLLVLVVGTLLISMVWPLRG
ncbi:SLC13 family permease [Phenylobacterium soli]|uniref:SLC13 family permease n=1 Tax=Phenylobacterium soli TaxID=2170551 RepID=A0A328AIN0_9CAUL|nr:SLC13 family permease [Phenylobacterium soli]RAK53926.1 SLC13 family permease [Phenylobacterium soli]